MTQKIRRNFNLYNIENPTVYKSFKQKSNSLYKNGIRHYSAWAIINNIRFQHDTRIKNSRFKVDNNYIALFVRKLMREDKKFKTFFTVKPLKIRGLNV